MSRSEAYQLRELVRAGLGAVVLALVPVGALLIGATGPALWRWASGVHTLMIVGAFAMVVWEFRGAEADERDSATSRITYLLGMTGMVLQGGNALGWPFDASAGVYFLGVLVPLAVAALFFTRLLFSRLFLNPGR